MAKPALYRAPLSGVIIGTIVKELRLENSTLADKTARRYFKGQRIKDTEKNRIFDAIGKAVVRQGLIPESPFLEREGFQMHKVVALCVASYSHQWDSLTGTMRTLSGPVDRQDLAAIAYLRLVTIDLALRVSALLWLAETEEPDEGTPLWAVEEGGAKYLKQILDQCGDSRPTREKLAELLGVSDNTVDNWLDSSVRPSRQHVERIAEELASRIRGVEIEALKRQLHRHYALSVLGNLLARHVGRAQVIDFATSLMRFVSRNLKGLRQFSKLPPEDAAARQFLILLYGARFPGCEHLLRALWRREEDHVWQTDLLAASKPWDLRLTRVNRLLGGLDQEVQLARDELGIPEEEAESLLDEMLQQAQADPTRLNKMHPSDMGKTVVRIKGDAKFSARNRAVQYEQATSEGDLETAILHIRRAVELQPENAMYHFHLGATLGKAGQFAEGIQECWIASQLDTEWELPKVEVGIILLNAGRNEEAREHLEAIVSDQQDPSGHLAFNVGVARLRSEDPNAALEMLEIAIKKQPDHAMALDYAAQCAFGTGDGKKGRELAKQAHQLGYSQTYREWREGKFLIKNKGVPQ